MIRLQRSVCCFGDLSRVIPEQLSCDIQHCRLSSLKVYTSISSLTLTPIPVARLRRPGATVRKQKDRKPESFYSLVTITHVDERNDNAMYLFYLLKLCLSFTIDGSPKGFCFNLSNKKEFFFCIIV